MLGRGMIFNVIDWDEGQAKLPFCCYRSSSGCTSAGQNWRHSRRIRRQASREAARRWPRASRRRPAVKHPGRFASTASGLMRSSRLSSAAFSSRCGRQSQGRLSWNGLLACTLGRMVCGAVRHPPGTVHCPTRVGNGPVSITGRLTLAA
jgi:hypothetical protein